MFIAFRRELTRFIVDSIRYTVQHGAPLLKIVIASPTPLSYPVTRRVNVTVSSSFPSCASRLSLPADRYENRLQLIDSEGGFESKRSGKKRGNICVISREASNKSAPRHNGIVRNQINICRDTITVKFNTRHRPDRSRPM